MDARLVNGRDGEPDSCCEVIQSQVKKDASVMFHRGNFQSTGDALGLALSWPLASVCFLSFTLEMVVHCYLYVLSISRYN